MLAGNIFIGKDIVIGTGDILILLITVGCITLNTFVAWANRKDRKYITRLIESAKDIDIGEDISLLEGLWAYFGDDGDWGEPYSDGIIPVLVGRHENKAGLFVNPRTKRINVLYFKCDGVCKNEVERQALPHLMVDVARGRADCHWT